jgi:hypothetical protein
MAKYLNPELVCRSFKRLSSRKRTGKTPKERTSALMYFLSIDATCKHFGLEVLDLNPDSLEGKNSRKQIELEYSKLVLVENINGNTKQVTELGKIDVSGSTPEKRISSNFFTVPLKKASGQSAPYHYPKRPDAPLLKMGPAATGEKWGVRHHDAWANNFPVLLSEIKDPTPSLDLAIFILRDCKWGNNNAVDVIAAITDQLRNRFTKSISDFWVSKIEKEKILAHHLDNPFTDNYASFLNYFEEDTPVSKTYEQMNKPELIDRIYCLEKLLNENGILTI